jgi:DNA-binding transcriptional LysR family regulator
LLTVLHGTGIGILPLRIVRDELAKRTIRQARVLPKLPAHRVSICYQISEFGPGLKALVDLARELVAHHKLFV